MTRPTSATIDLDALRNNYRAARRIHGGRALAVLKANAYGHGAIACAQALAPVADGFAVAFLDEACALREAGVTHPILILEGVFDERELQLASLHDVWVVIHHDEQIRMLSQSRLPPGRLNVWMKIDSGMRRAGIACADAESAYERILSTGKVDSIALMTHFACADEPTREDTAYQIQRFDNATRRLPGKRSLSNSAGLLAWPAARRDWGRPGLALYGALPREIDAAAFTPAMTFSSRIFATRTLAPGDSVGYGATFTATREMRIGLVCAGYADGYPQTAPSGTPVSVNGQRTSLVGRVSMDLIIVDITSLPDAGIGSPVELWGRQISVAEVGAACGRIPYELLCNVKRAPLSYRDMQAPLDIQAGIGARFAHS
jgi:alanine racemase